MPRITYKLSAGGWSVDSAEDSRTELVELDVLHEMASPAGHCRVTAYAPREKEPSGLQQLAGAAASAIGDAVGLGGGGGAGASGPTTKVRGQDLAAKDAMTVELTVGNVSAKVATARLQSVESSLERVTLVGYTGMQELAATRVNQVYENQTLGQIVRDLASQAGVSTGDIDDGARYPYLAVHESRSVLRNVLDLARREGLDVYCDVDDRLTVKRFSKSRPDHVLTYGTDILSLAVRSADPVATRVLVHGESPASSSGSDTWHQLVDDLGPYRGESGSGARLRAIQDGAVRTKDAADTAAAARLSGVQGRAVRGRVSLLGRPTLKVGDAIEIKGLPTDDFGGLLKVGSARHVLDQREGYVTVAGFTVASAGGPGSGALGSLGGLLP